ncbi:MAG: extracellular solute-binding protein [Phototrophicaceae bacterium]
MKKWIFVSLIFILLSPRLVFSQGDPVIISLAFPGQMSDVINEEFMESFEANHPNVNVDLVPIFEQTQLPPPWLGMEQYLGAASDYVSRADVVPIDSNILSAHSTRAGYFLDIQPFLYADSAFSPDNFAINTLESLQWDNATWGMPISANVTVLAYNKQAFDDAGLTYPNPNWTVDDFDNVIRQFANLDSSIAPFPMFSNISMLFRTLATQSFVSTADFSIAPDFSDPELERVITIWDALNRDGLLGPENISPTLVDSPMFLMTVDSFVGISLMNPTLGVTLLPQDQSIMTVNGFAISAGTAHPQESYALLQFLSQQVETTFVFQDPTPAQIAFSNTEFPYQIERGEYTEEQRALLNTAVQNSLPASEILFNDYINFALFNSRFNETTDILSVLQDAEIAAQDDLLIAENEQAQSINISNNVFEDTDGLVLNFGIGTSGVPLATLDAWEALADEFVEDDPNLADIEFDVGFATSEESSQINDCFFLNYNAVPSLDLTMVINLDPLLNTDEDFLSADTLDNILSLVQRDNKTWAYPLAIQPFVLSYDENIFAELGIPIPDGNWRIDQFRSVLNILSVDSDLGYSPSNATGIYMLIIANGGLPIDYRTSPPTIDFTSAETINAIRQVLDLARSGSISYVGLIDTSTEQNFLNAIEDVQFSAFGTAAQATDDYNLISFPNGMVYTPVSLDVGTAYISSNSQNIDVCYRWISTLSHHPELFDGMPIRQSQISANEIDPNRQLYLSIAEQLSSPNAVVVPSGFDTIATPINIPLHIWLNRAFDNYVLNDANLEQELAQAQVFAEEYLGCAAGVSQDQFQSIAQLAAIYTQCALDVDNSLSEVLD